jgi:hypothetical protein
MPRRCQLNAQSFRGRRPARELTRRRELRVTQGAVSHQVKVEMELGIKLFTCERQR